MKVNKKYFSLLIVLFLIIISTTKVNAVSIEKYINKETNYEVIIEDDANLLSESEINKLQKEIVSLTKFGNIAFKTINENFTTTSNYASNYYHEKFGTSSGTLFLIDMDNRYIYIFSDGDNYKTITTGKANIITDNVYKYASNKQYYECASKSFRQINSLLNGEKIKEPMRYISNIFISFIVVFFINFIIVLCNTKIRKTKNKDILSNCNIKFDINNINAVKTGTRKVYSPISDSSSSGGYSGGGFSSGGSSGGGFSGGGSSGGGGGHRF